MFKRNKNLVSFLLALLLVLTSMPIAALANDGEKPIYNVTFKDRYGIIKTVLVEEGSAAPIPEEFFSEGEIITLIEDEDGNKRNPSHPIFRDETFTVQYGESIDIIFSLVGDKKYNNKPDQLIRPTKVTLSAGDVERHKQEYGLKNTNRATVANALYKTLESDEELSKEINDLKTQISDGYISSMFGLAAKTHPDERDGWMYYINHEYVAFGLNEAVVLNEDYIRWFYVEDFTKNSYTWFDEKSATTRTGQEFEVTLNYSKFDMDSEQTTKGLYSGATILVNDEVYKVDGKPVKTNEAGKAIIRFEEAGNYAITATHRDENEKLLITMPYMDVEVVLYGDLDGDGVVTLKDLTSLGRYLAGWDGYTEDTLNLSVADVNGDGFIKLNDITIMGRHMAGWEDYKVLPYVK